MHHRTGRLFLLGLVLAALGACQGRQGVFGEPGGASPRAAGGRVSLTDADLAPLDAYIGVRNSQWILGDDVEVFASREYFGQNLTIARASGLVERRDSSVDGETTVTLTYVGDPGMASVGTNPRLLIGLGLTVTARRTLVLHLMRTRDANRPVELRVNASGNASRGRKEEVLERAPQLQLGGEIRRDAAGGWTWTPLG
jgi:hypothetical protein